MESKGLTQLSLQSLYETTNVLIFFLILLALVLIFLYGYLKTKREEQA